MHNAAQLSALSRLFSPGVFRELASKGQSPLFARLLAQANVLGLVADAPHTVGEAFDVAFSLLRKSGVRDEYVYRSAITHNVLLGRHSLNSASMLTEFRAGLSKADVVILNGTSTVYEIKSDRDSLSRLAGQLSNYRRVFDRIFVIAGEAHVHDVLRSTTPDVGILSLSRWNRISTVREAEGGLEWLCQATIFDSLRIGEARKILEALGVDIPDLPNTKIRAAMRELFRLLPAKAVHDQMVVTLKETRSLSSLSSALPMLPMSLYAAVLSAGVGNEGIAQLSAAVRTPLTTAINWA